MAIDIQKIKSQLETYLTDESDSVKKYAQEGLDNLEAEDIIGVYENLTLIKLLIERRARGQ